MKTVALIPARGGSRGLPGKNIKRIYGKPLIAWSIEQALSSKSISEVYVSTNCPKIADVSLNYGAKIPFLRPKKLSDDMASTESAVLHFCSEMKKLKENFDNILLIQCTSPVRACGRFDDALKYFEINGYDSLVAVTESRRFHWKNFDKPEALYDFEHRPRRQDITENSLSYIETGSFYLFKNEKFFKHKNRIFGKVGLYKTPENEMFDIDNVTDFSICEKLLSIQSLRQNFAA